MARNIDIKINLDQGGAVQGMNQLGRSVGAVEKESARATTRLRQMREQLVTMDRGTQEFRNLEREAAKLQDSIDAVSNRVRILSSDTFALEAGTAVVSSMAGAYGLVTSATALMGVESEELMQTLVKLQAVQQFSNSLTQVANSLRKDSITGIVLRNAWSKIRGATQQANNNIDKIAISTTRAFTKSQRANIAATGGQTVATNAATMATRALGLAMKALPIVAVLGALAMLTKSFMDNNEKLRENNRLFEEAKQKTEDFIKLQERQEKTIKKLAGDAMKILDRQRRLGIITEEEYEEAVLNSLETEKKRALEAVKVAKVELNKKVIELKGTLDLQEMLLMSDHQRRKYIEELNTELVSEEQRKVLQSLIDNLGARKKLFKQVAEDIVELEVDIQVRKNKEQKKGNENYKDILNERLKLEFQINEQRLKNEQQFLEQERKELEKDFPARMDLRVDILRQIQAKELELIKLRNEEEIRLADGNAKQIELINLKLNEKMFNTVVKFEEEKRKLSLESNRLMVNNTQEMLSLPKQSGEHLRQAMVEWMEFQRHLEQINNQTTQLFVQSLDSAFVGVRGGITGSFEDMRMGFEQLSINLFDPQMGFFKQFEDGTLTMGEWLRDNVHDVIGETMRMANDLMVVLNQNLLESEQDRLSTIVANREEQLTSMFANMEISEEEHNDRLREMEQEKRNEERRLLLEDFRRRKGIAMIDAAINTASSVLQAMAMFGPPIPINPMGMAAVGTAVGMGALQTGLIAAQQPPAFNRGGVVGFGSDEDKDSVMAMLTKGEAVINRSATEAFLPLLSAINESTGGASLAPTILTRKPVKNKTYSENNTINNQNSKQVIEAFVALDRLDYMQNSSRRNKKNNTIA